jgi:hypothetical protein
VLAVPCERPVFDDTDVVEENRVLLGSGCFLPFSVFPLPVCVCVCVCVCVSVCVFRLDVLNVFIDIYN